MFEINRYLKREKVDGDRLPRLDGSLNILDFSLAEDKPVTDENKSSNERSAQRLCQIVQKAAEEEKRKAARLSYMLGEQQELSPLQRTGIS